MIGTDGGKESGKHVLSVWHDYDDELSKYFKLLLAQSQECELTIFMTQGEVTNWHK